MTKRTRGRIRRRVAWLFGLALGGLAGFGIGVLAVTRGVERREEPDPTRSDLELVVASVFEALAVFAIIGMSVVAGIVIVSPITIRGLNHVLSGYALLICDPTDRRYARRLRRNFVMRGVTVKVADLPTSPDRPGPAAGLAMKERLKLDQCAALIVLASPAADRSDTIRRVTTAAEADSTPIFPVVVDGDEVPLIAARFQYFDARDTTMLSRRRLPTRQFIKSIIRCTG